MSNAKVYSFSDGVTTFTATSGNGVYVKRGSANSAQVVNRVEVTGAGAIHDMDGTDDAALTPAKHWQEFLFVGAHPAAHAQYDNLAALVGHHGTLTFRRPNGTTYETTTAPARLLPWEGEWEPPYKAVVTNWLTIRVEWQLKDFPS